MTQPQNYVYSPPSSVTAMLFEGTDEDLAVVHSWLIAELGGTNVWSLDLISKSAYYEVNGVVTTVSYGHYVFKDDFDKFYTLSKSTFETIYRTSV